jgi:hypothetical protein
VAIPAGFIEGLLGPRGFTNASEKGGQMKWWLVKAVVRGLMNRLVCSWRGHRLLECEEVRWEAYGGETRAYRSTYRYKHCLCCGAKIFSSRRVDYFRRVTKVGSEI